MEEIYKGLKIKIEQDESCFNPREDDNFGNMTCFHNRYKLGDDHSLSVDDLKNIIARKDVISLPLFLYDHGGISMKTYRHGYHGAWDCGQVGYIYVTYEEIRKNFNCKKVTKNLKEKTLKILEAEVEIYNSYLIGEVYSYVISTLEDEDLDNCGGFIGEADDCLNEARRRVLEITNNGTTDHKGQKLFDYAQK